MAKRKPGRIVRISDDAYELIDAYRRMCESEYARRRAEHAEAHGGPPEHVVTGFSIARCLDGMLLEREREWRIAHGKDGALGAPPADARFRCIPRLRDLVTEPPTEAQLRRVPSQREQDAFIEERHGHLAALDWYQALKDGPRTEDD